MLTSPPRAALAALAALAIIAPAAPALADEIAFGSHDIVTTFFISKSDDKNHVDYGMRLDENCAPVGDDPVFPYWREFEKAPPVRTHGLSLLDKIPYGISSQKTLKRGATGAEHVITLKQLPNPIYITTKKETDGRCSALTRATVGGSMAQLRSVFAKLAGFASVDYIDLFGADLTTGAAITERIKK